MRLSASISPPLRLFTCRRNQFLAGIEACCRGSACGCNVPAVANNSERQSEVPQRTHPPFARWASLPLSTIKIDLSKKNCGSSVISLNLSESLVNTAILDLGIGPEFRSAKPFL